ncbi:MAG: MATE family efflux transporter [Hyphomicrobiaceae bacterium]
MSAPHAAMPDAEARRSGPLRHREVGAIALPIILSNATVPLVGYVDTVVIGQQVGAAHLIGGVALSSVIFSNIYWIFGFLRMGTTGLTAQAAGAGNLLEVTANLLRALIVAGVAGLALVLVQSGVIVVFLQLMGGSARVDAVVSTYFHIRIWGAPAALANFAFMGWFIGLGRADIAFVLQLILNGVNIALSVLFVLGWHWGVTGVAWASVISDVVAAAAGLWIAARELRRRGAVLAEARLSDRGALRTMFDVNRDVIIRTACLIFATSFFAAQGARSGDLILAANAVLLSITLIFIHMLDGFAFAAETLVGQAVGGRRRDRFRAAVRMSTLWGVAVAIAFSAVMWFGGGALIDFTTDDPPVRDLAREYLVWAALVPVVGIWCYQLDGIFVGATGSAQMRNTAIASVVVYLAAWAILSPALGNHGLWAAYLVLLATRAVTLGLCLPGLEQRKFQFENRRA